MDEEGVMVGLGGLVRQITALYTIFLQCLTNYTTRNEFRNRGGGRVGLALIAQICSPLTVMVTSPYE